MIRPRKLKPRETRELRHWAIELAVVVVGVLLALGVAEWAADRREAREHEQRVERMETAIANAAVSAAVAQAIYACEDARFARIKELLDEHGRDWPGIEPDPAVAALNARLLTPMAIIVNSDSLPTEPFEAAEAAGTYATLSDEDAEYFRVRAQQFGYMNDAFDDAVDAMAALRVLGEARQLSQAELDTARRALATADLSKFIMRVQGETLIETHRERHNGFDERFWSAFESRLASDSYRGLDCFAPVDPRDGRQWKGAEWKRAPSRRK